MPLEVFTLLKGIPGKEYRKAASSPYFWPKPRITLWATVSPASYYRETIEFLLRH
jgi:hypothetical protein